MPQLDDKVDKAIICYFTKDAVPTAVEVAKYAGLHVAVVKTTLPPAYYGSKLDPRTLEDHLMLFSKIPVDAATAAATFQSHGTAVSPGDIEIRV